MKQASYVAEPFVSGIAQLLDDIESGHLLIARFQRPLVWEPEQQLELLRSIRSGLPIGMILIWRTRGQHLPCYDRIGRHLLRGRDVSGGGSEQYLLDGFQRLATLYTAFRRDDDPAPEEDARDDDRADDVDGSQTPPWFYLDLDTGDFWGSPTEESAPNLLPLWALMDRMELLRQERGFPKEKESWVEHAEAAFVAFDRCKIPVSPLVTDDLEVALSAFERINSQLVEVGRLRAVHALSWSRSFDLLGKTRELKDRMLKPIGWGGLDDDVVLEVCTLLLALPLDGRQERVAKALREKPETLEGAVVGLKLAAEFLQTQGIVRPFLVPYGRQLVLLAAVLGQDRALPPQELLSSWLWLTTYSELFAGISGKRLQRVHDALQQAARTGRLTWSGWRPFQRRALGGRLDPRSARAKALAVLLGSRAAAVEPGGQPIDFGRLQHENTVPELLFRAVTRAEVPQDRFASAGNCFVVPPEQATRFREELMQMTVDGLDASGDVAVSPEESAWLQGHVVSPAALLHLAHGRLADFVARRERDLDALEDEAVHAHLANLSAESESP